MLCSPSCCSQQDLVEKHDSKTSECNCILRCWICAHQSVSSARRRGSQMRNETADSGLSSSTCTANFDTARCGASSTQTEAWTLLGAKPAKRLKDREKLSKDSVRIPQPAEITEIKKQEDARWRRSDTERKSLVGRGAAASCKVCKT